MNKRKILIVIAVVLAVWLALGITDFYQVTRFEKPAFCVLINGQDDGGSGTYLGLGYSFEIEGNFMPDDEYPGVTYYEAKLFGISAEIGIRD